MSRPLIVVPLDGSKLSECAVPYATAFAKALDAHLLLVTVWEGADHALVRDLPHLAEELFQQGEQFYQRYLAGVARKVRRKGLAVEAQVLIGHPAEEIIRVLEDREARLLVMASHGRSGLGRWWYGSVAGQLSRRAPVPTLIVGPKVLADGRRTAKVRSILVPLDASELAEIALQPARELAQALGARLVLAQVLSWASQAYTFDVPSVAAAKIDRELTKSAEEYLARAAERLGRERPVRRRVLHGAPADALIDLVARERIGLVVMASHGRGGLARAALGSVADRMLQGTAPVLLIRPQALASIVRPSRGRHCHNCGRVAPYTALTSDDRCLRCGHHLHVCGNCVYFDGITCLMQRPEVRDTYPGLKCPAFQFRETRARAPAASGRPRRTAAKGRQVKSRRRSPR